MIELIVQVVILAVSLIVLSIAGHFTIKSVEEIIELTGLSEASAGFVILSVMTSTPEVTVAAFSILQGTPGVSVGDILGSNVANIGLVVGILAVIGPLEACCTDLLREMVDILFLSSLIPLILITFGTLSPLVGASLLGVFAFSMYRMTKGKSPASVDKGIVTSDGKNKKTVVAKMVGGIVAVALAARFVVTSASNTAIFFGIPPILLGAKIIAVGTSLPELALDVSAVRRGRPRLALGDAIGSNLTNLTFVLGIVLITSPFAVDLTVFAETLPFLLITTLLLWRFVTKGGISKFGGILLIIVYVLFQAII